MSRAFRTTQVSRSAEKGPAADTPGQCVQRHGQEQEAGERGHEGDVGDPKLLGFSTKKVRRTRSWAGR